MTERCPYCDSKIEINHDDGYGYSEDDIHQQECGVCGKTFTYTTTLIFHYSLYKADCLNDGEHDYQVTKTFPRRYSRLYCTVCGDTKPLPPDHPYLKEE